LSTFSSTKKNTLRTNIVNEEKKRWGFFKKKNKLEEPFFRTLITTAAKKGHNPVKHLPQNIQLKP
jgi:hypothetical protein